MTENLLGDDGEDNQPITDPNKSYREELVGENKKFRDDEALARGKYESDLYIRQLERKLDEMREDYVKARDDATSRANLAELIDQLKGQQNTSNENNPNVNDSNNKPVVDPVEIEALIAAKLQESEMSRKYEENTNLVKNKLIERYGSNYKNVLKEHVENLGLTPEFVNEMVRKHPQALFRTLGIDQEPSREQFQAPPRSNQRTDNFAPRTEKRTWSYYQNMRKNNPSVYNDPKTTVQMHKDAVELGDAFNDGDWNSI